MEKRRDWGQAGALKTLEPEHSPHQSISKVLQSPMPPAQAGSNIHAEQRLLLLCLCLGFSFSFVYLLEMFKYKQNLQDAVEVTGVTDVKFENKLGVRSTCR